jgi:hypothetical protein
VSNREGTLVFLVPMKPVAPAKRDPVLDKVFLNRSRNMCKEGRAQIYSDRFKSTQFSTNPRPATQQSTADIIQRSPTAYHDGFLQQVQGCSTCHESTSDGLNTVLDQGLTISTSSTSQEEGADYLNSIRRLSDGRIDIQPSSIATGFLQMYLSFYSPTTDYEPMVRIMRL